MRNFATRVNSSVSCLNETNFPSTYGGARPFTANLTNPDLLEFKICVPGAYDEYPWPETRDRRTITEQLYLEVKAPASLKVSWDHPQTFTIRHDAQYTLGYFELGNRANNDEYGPFLPGFPEFYDFSDDFYYGRLVGEIVPVLPRARLTTKIFVDVTIRRIMMIVVSDLRLVHS